VRRIVRVWEVRAAYKILVGKPEWMRPLKTPVRREDHINMELDEIRCGQVYQTENSDLAHMVIAALFSVRKWRTNVKNFRVSP
jgi:hypothetical protein